MLLFEAIMVCVLHGTEIRLLTRPVLYISSE